jgi:CubicO group peptidase (beta-lactamase class C family)
VEKCAATEIIDGKPLIGDVHDPMARIVMLGNSGNAGLFSTADDLAIYAAMLLNHGTWNNQRILSPLGVKAFSSIPEGYEQFGRGLGWDLNSAYASNQGDLLSAATFGHTGYTGTSIVIDPENNLAVILLTNRVHPDDKGSVVRLRSIISNIVASAIN